MVNTVGLDFIYVKHFDVPKIDRREEITFGKLPAPGLRDGPGPTSNAPAGKKLLQQCAGLGLQHATEHINAVVEAR